MTRIDRRALFTTGAAAALLSATGLTLDAAPSRGGQLRVAIPRPDGPVIPAARAAVFDTLTELAPDGVLRGGLATRWQSDDAGAVWDFALRDDVAFHDGSPLRPEDVVASVLSWDGIAVLDATTPGAGQVRLRLAAGNPQLPYLLTQPGRLVLRAADAGAPDQARIGTGLYRTLRDTPGRDFLGQRVDQHFKDGQAGWFDSVEIVVIPDAAVRAEALRDGFVDVAELPLAEGLTGKGAFQYHPSAENMALAAHERVGMPRVISPRAPLDDARIAERWWMG